MKTTKILLIVAALLVAISPLVTFADTDSDYADDSMEWDYADNSMEWDYADNSMEWDYADNSMEWDYADNSMEWDYADNSMEWDYADNSMEWDYADNSYGYRVGRGYTYDYGNSYYPRGRSNWVGVGLVGSTVGWQPTPPVMPTPPGNIVTPGYTVNPVVYTQPTYYPQIVTVTQTIPNQVQAYQDTNPSLDSVYLSDVPYTGLSDYYGLIIFISILLSWSAMLAYVFLKRKISEKMSFANVYTNIVSDNKNDSINSEFANQIVSDKTDIREVEEYAREKKVLLSTDASAKLIKLQRLGEGNIKSIIDSLSTNEWIAIGEKDLER